VNGSSATDSPTVIKTALDAFGGVAVLINHAGILRDLHRGFSHDLICGDQYRLRSLTSLYMRKSIYRLSPL
jgi:hypothetical protein